MPLSASALRTVLLPGLIGGTVAGLIASLLHQLFLVPLILHAEAIELGGAQHLQHGIDRMLGTMLFDCLGAIGFALLLAAALVYRPPSSWKQGLMWGIAGFATFSLAPALGLPPQLPGAEGAPLLARQLWWLGCALSTGVGLAAYAFARAPILRVLGIALIVVPHVIGAPAGGILAVSNQRSARDFALTSLAIAFVMWTLIGVLTAASMRRVGKSHALTGSATRAG
jgi:cobalt transporter subunit CbtA